MAPAIRTTELSKRYGETVALDRLDLTVERGEVYGYLGPNGAGKTTTIRLLLGLHRPTGGRGELFGMDAWADPVSAHRRVAYVAGEPFLWPSLTAGETLEFLARLRSPAAVDDRGRGNATDIAYRDRLVGRFRARHAQEGASAVEGKPPEGAADRRPRHARRVVAPRRADQRP